MRRSRELSRGSAPDLRGFRARAALSSSFSFPSASSDGSGVPARGGAQLGAVLGLEGVREGVSRVDARHESAGVALGLPGEEHALGVRVLEDPRHGERRRGGRRTVDELGDAGRAVVVDVRAARGKRRSEDALNWRTTTRRARRSTGRVRVRAGGSARTSGKRLAAGSGRFRVQRLEKSYFRIFQGRGGKRARRLSVENSTRASLRAAPRDAGRGGDGAGRGTRNPVADPSSRSEGETRSDRKRVAGAIRSRATRPTCPSHNV